LVSELSQPLSLRAEVVEILEREGRLIARVRVEPNSVLGLAANGMVDLHLGDQLRIDGLLVVERVERAPEGAAEESR